MAFAFGVRVCAAGSGGGLGNSFRFDALRAGEDGKGLGSLRAGLLPPELAGVVETMMWSKRDLVTPVDFSREFRFRRRASKVFG